MLREVLPDWSSLPRTVTSAATADKTMALLFMFPFFVAFLGYQTRIDLAADSKA